MDLSKNELRTILEILNQCLSISDKNKFSGLMDLIGNVLPFDAVSLAILDEPENQSGHQSAELVNHSYSPELVSNYINNRFVNTDAVVTRGQNEPAAYNWYDTYFLYENLTEDPNEIITAGSGHGLEKGYACACHSQPPESFTTLLSLSSKDENIEPRNYDILAFIMPHLHEAVRRLYRSNASSEQYGESNNAKQVAQKSTQSLTNRELEILKWAVIGKTSWEIGRILSISERTVKFHFKNTYKKLDVINRSQAVAKAVSHGLVAV